MIVNEVAEQSSTPIYIYIYMERERERERDFSWAVSNVCYKTQLLQGNANQWSLHTRI